MEDHKEQKNLLDPEIETILSTLPQQMQQETRKIIQGVQPLLSSAEWAGFQVSLMGDFKLQHEKLLLEKEMADIVKKKDSLEQAMDELKKILDEIKKNRKE